MKDYIIVIIVIILLSVMHIYIKKSEHIAQKDAPSSKSSCNIVGSWNYPDWACKDTSTRPRPPPPPPPPPPLIVKQLDPTYNKDTCSNRTNMNCRYISDVCVMNEYLINIMAKFNKPALIRDQEKKQMNGILRGFHNDFGNNGTIYQYVNRPYDFLDFKLDAFQIIKQNGVIIIIPIAGNRLLARNTKFQNLYVANYLKNGTNIDEQLPNYNWEIVGKKVFNPSILFIHQNNKYYIYKAWANMKYDDGYRAIHIDITQEVNFLKTYYNANCSKPSNTRVEYSKTLEFTCI